LICILKKNGCNGTLATHMAGLSGSSHKGVLEGKIRLPAEMASRDAMENITSTAVPDVGKVLYLLSCSGL
jgi:hypothetical protein